MDEDVISSKSIAILVLIYNAVNSIDQLLK